MGLPAGRVGGTTVTGDVISGPGVPVVLVGGGPAVVLGDLVSGPTCTGAIVKGSATVMIGGRPAVRVGDSVSGANPATGVPVTTAVAPPGCPNVMIGG